ncbi:hypothetical protein Pla52n_22300 [Stieleria varia]|uniref:Uncharacterized protein n=1 Tax=Stieleria varia TaxID=2528005 RepID=A0A5C6B3K2_9BACT|nr:hypothetical protein Pla52n_22300 [Stieleria varia]
MQMASVKIDALDFVMHSMTYDCFSKLELIRRNRLYCCGRSLASA